MRKIILITSLSLIGLYCLFQKLSSKEDEHKPTFADVKEKSVKLPYSFKTALAKKLADKARGESKSKNYKEAIELLQAAINKEPTNPGLYFDIANCYSSIDKFEDAIVFLNDAINLDSTYFGLYNNRGLVYYKLWNNEKAISDYNKALQLDSTKPIVYINLALAHYSNHDNKDACAALKKAQSLGLDVNELGAKAAKDLKGTCE